MNLLNKLTIKNLKLNKKRTIVTIIGIMLSVALITAVSTIYSSAISSLIKFATYEKGYYHAAFYAVPKSEISIFENNKKIEELYLTQNVGYAKLEESKNEYKPYVFVKAFTKGSLENLSIKLVEGRLPLNENEIIIPTHLKTNGRVTLNIGDTITLDVGKRVDSEGYELNQKNPYRPNDTSEEGVDAETGEVISSTYSEESDEDIVDTQSRTYKIVGIIERPATSIESYTAPGYTFITYMDNDDIISSVDIFAQYTSDGIKDSYKVTAGLLGVDGEIFETVYGSNYVPDENEDAYLRELDKVKYEFDINGYLITLQTNPIKDSSVSGLGAVVVIVCLIIIFTSVFCIKNSFDISITEKIKQYGMLRSVGATKRQIKKNVFYEATILGIIGIPLGILLGFIASFLLIIISNYFLKDILTRGLKLELSISLVAVLVSVILGVVTIYFSAFRSARRAAKVSPIDSIRNSANIKIKSKRLKSPKVIKKLFGMGGEISYKNLKRNKKKYRTTVISIVVSVFVFIALTSFMSYAFMTIENELSIRDENILLSLNVRNDQLYEKALETVGLDTIENYTVKRINTFNIDNPKYNDEFKELMHIQNDSDWGGNVTVVSVGEEQYKKYTKSLGLDYGEIKDKGILVDTIDVDMLYQEEQKTVTYKVREFSYEIGDKISGKLESEIVKELEIGYVTTEEPFGLNYNYSSIIIISDSMFDSFDINDYHMSIYYKSSDPDKLQDDIDEVMKGENYNLNNIAEHVRQMESLYTLVGIFLYGFIIVISLIGITNIFNTITTNMELRKQEFAMLKSVGMTSREFNRMIRLESVFMGVKALLFGVPIGVFLSYIIYHYLVKDSGMVYQLPIVAILITICAVFILISLIMKYSMNKINKQNTIETIRNENI